MDHVQQQSTNIKPIKTKTNKQKTIQLNGNYIETRLNHDSIVVEIDFQRRRMLIAQYAAVVARFFTFAFLGGDAGPGHRGRRRGIGLVLVLLLLLLLLLSGAVLIAADSISSSRFVDSCRFQPVLSALPAQRIVAPHAGRRCRRRRRRSIRIRRIRIRRGRRCRWRGRRQHVLHPTRSLNGHLPVRISSSGYARETAIGWNGRHGRSSISVDWLDNGRRCNSLLFLLLLLSFSEQQLGLLFKGTRSGAEPLLPLVRIRRRDRLLLVHAADGDDHLVGVESARRQRRRRSSGHRPTANCRTDVDVDVRRWSDDHFTLATINSINKSINKQTSQ